MAEIDLRTAIDKIVEDGDATNPYAVVDRLVYIHGKEWAKKQAAIRYREILAREAQSALGRFRRAKQRAIRDAKDEATSALIEVEFWIPTRQGPVWKRMGDFTVDDHYLRLAWLRKLGGAILVQARWHEDVVAMMRAQRVSKTDEVDELPELPQVGPPGHPRLLGAAS